MHSLLRRFLSALVVLTGLAALTASGAFAQTAAPVGANCIAPSPLGYYGPYGVAPYAFAPASCQIVDLVAPISAPATVFVVSASTYGPGPSECDGVSAVDYTTQNYSGPLPPLPPDLQAWLAAPGGCAFSVTSGIVSPGEPLGTELFSGGANPPAGPTQLNALVCGDPSCGAYDASIYGPPPLPPFNPYPTYQTYQPPTPPVVITYPYVVTQYLPSTTYCTDRDQDCDIDPSGSWRRHHHRDGDDASGDGDHHRSDSDAQGSWGSDRQWNTSADPPASSSAGVSNTWTTTSTSPAPSSTTSSSPTTTWTWTSPQTSSSTGSSDPPRHPSTSTTVSTTSSSGQPGSAGTSHASTPTSTGDTDQRSTASTTSHPSPQVSAGSTGQSGQAGQPGQSGHSGHSGH